MSGFSLSSPGPRIAHHFFRQNHQLQHHRIAPGLVPSYLNPILSCTHQESLDRPGMNLHKTAVNALEASSPNVIQFFHTTRLRTCLTDQESAAAKSCLPAMHRSLFPSVVVARLLRKDQKTEVGGSQVPSMLVFVVIGPSCQISWWVAAQKPQKTCTCAECVRARLLCTTIVGMKGVNFNSH